MFKDLDIKKVYRTNLDYLSEDFIIPVLRETIQYDRCSGYFSLKTLGLLAKGLIPFFYRGGILRIITSVQLDEEDLEMIHNAYKDIGKVLEDKILEEIEEKVDSEEMLLSLDLITNLISLNKIQIKVGAMRDKGIYHEKTAFFKDDNGDCIWYGGSMNETNSGLQFNRESIAVFKSWKDQEEFETIKKEEIYFDNLWNNKDDYVQIMDFPEAAKNKLFSKYKTKTEISEIIENIEKYYKRYDLPYEIRPYQQVAKDNWIKNGMKGFFVMATGTGKTITSLYSIKELIKEKQVLTIIAVPYIHLVSQWYEDVIKFFPDADVYCVHSEMKNVEQGIYASYNLAKNNYRPIIVITTIVSFFLERFANLYDVIDFEKLLIIDEAHNFLSKINDDLSNKYKYKLGLSATPVFGKDEEKTKTLINWFGGLTMDFPIDKAIGKYLVNYEYIPIFINATEEDEIEFKKATQAMTLCFDKKGVLIDQEKYTLAYRRRLRAISMAKEKITNIKQIFCNVAEDDHVIIYCSDGKMFSDEYKVRKDDEKSIRHLEYMLKMLNQSLITNNIMRRASKFTATEDLSTRIKLIDSFNNGDIHYLVAIKCLDEGINIPSIKSALILSSNDNYREFVQRRGRILRLYKGKEVAKIYDVIVLPSQDTKTMAEIEFRRFFEYSKLAINKKELIEKLEYYLSMYNLDYDNIVFKNDYAEGENLDE